MSPSDKSSNQNARRNTSGASTVAIIDAFLVLAFALLVTAISTNLSKKIPRTNIVGFSQEETHLAFIVVDGIFLSLQDKLQMTTSTPEEIMNCIGNHLPDSRNLTFKEYRKGEDINGLKLDLKLSSVRLLLDMNQINSTVRLGFVACCAPNSHPIEGLSFDSSRSVPLEDIEVLYNSEGDDCVLDSSEKNQLTAVSLPERLSVESVSNEKCNVAILTVEKG